MKKKLKKMIISGDKSITHRAVIMASCARGKSVIYNPLYCDDTMATIDAFRKLGINITVLKNKMIVIGKGLYGLSCPSGVIDCHNSATTMRLLMGLLAGQEFDSVLTGDENLMSRPMDRIIDPLTEMGASIRREGNAYLISGRKLHSIQYDMPVSSAQVKSALLLAGMYTGEKMLINDPGNSRDHTELMFKEYGKAMKGRKLFIPGDISSAAFFIAKALITKNAEIKLLNVGINSTRTGCIDAMKAMGADITVNNIRRYGYEPVADIKVRFSHLHGTEIKGDIIPRIIDELPVISVLAGFADGITTIADASELRFKESDRIKAMYDGLKSLGINVSEKADGLEIEGSAPDRMRPAVIDSHCDHRVAMSFLILTDIVPGLSVLKKECVAVSCPTFINDLNSLFCS